MPLELIEVGTSASIGAADLVAGWFDDRQGYTKAFQNIQDIGRAVYVVGGYAAESMGYFDEKVTKTAVLAGIPLLEHSIYNAFRELTASPRKPRSRNPKVGLRLKEEGQGPRGSTVRYV